MTKAWTLLLGVEKTVVEWVELDECGQELVVHVRPKARWAKRPRCGVCGVRCPRYDAGRRRRWRTLDLGTVAVGRIIDRVVAEFGDFDPLDGLRRIGIDEISCRKGHRYLTVVVDHDSGRLVWAAPGRDMKTLHAFFDKLGPERTAAIEAVSADAASWIRNVVEDRCPQAALCMDPYHVVAWATDALDKVRRQVFQLPVDAALDLLEQWPNRARRCRLGPFVDLAKRITRHRERIAASLRLRLSNGLVESMNTKIRLIMRRAFGFHSPEPLIGLAMLDLRGLCPQLPGRGR